MQFITKEEEISWGLDQCKIHDELASYHVHLETTPYIPLWNVHGSIPLLDPP